MSAERKDVMISARASGSLIARVDFVVRNTDSGPVTNRSTAVLDALEKWLPEREAEIERKLGSAIKKAR